MDFKSLKKNSTSFDKLTKALESAGTTRPKNDDRFWSPAVDKAGNGYAVIRFLDAPAVDGESAMPWVQVFNHGFQGPGGWLIDSCLTTINQKCPVCEHNSSLWNSGVDSNKEVARKQKRKLNYLSNIVVVKDSSNPENEGKVFLFKYGKKIFDKIKEKIEPQFEDEKAINPFNFWQGANFKLKIRTEAGYRNYDKSEFDLPSPLFGGDDDEIEKVWKGAYSLKEFLNPELFMSYNDLKAKLDRTLGAAPDFKARSKSAEDVELEEEVVLPSSSSDDDEMSYFSNLANE